MTPKYWLVLGVVTVGTAQVVGCTSHFTSCDDSSSCGANEATAGHPDPGKPSDEADAGSAGSAGSVGNAGNAGSADNGEGGAIGEAGAATNLGGSAGSAPLPPALFGSCDAAGRTVCAGIASADRLSCDGSKWQPGSVCPQGKLCDSSSGSCAKVIPECVTVKPGDTVCRGDTVLKCGPDLVTTDEGKLCDGVCKDGACQAPACGDKKVEPGEECDDGNLIVGDGCSATCKWEAVDVVAGGSSSCALSAGGQVKCWGDNTQGALGQGDSVNRGVSHGQLGDALKPIALGAQRTAKSISVGVNAACAVLDDGSLKCWGANNSGQLGAAYGSAQGDDPDEMGDNLHAIPLGTGRTAISVSEGGYHTCAVLDDGEVKCWGSGASGQLGQDSALDIPSPAQISGVPLGGKAITVSAGNNNTTCALLADASGKCWGSWKDGAISVSGFSSLGGDKYAVGDYAGEMEMLPALSIGARIKALGAGAQSSCALLEDGNVKCWGRTALGQGDTETHGFNPTELLAVPPVFLGSGRKAKAISVGDLHVCVVLDDGGIKCWGDNTYGQIAAGSVPSIGDAPGQMAALLELPLGKKALKVSAGRQHTCALLEDRSVVCWGANDKGQLGLGNTDFVGNAPGFTPKAVDLTF